MTTAINYAIGGEGNGRTAAEGVLFGPLSILARQKKTWSPVLLAGVLWRAVSNIGRHHRILEVLKLPEYTELAHADPRFAFKYLTHGYLSRSLSVAERASCFTHHYKTLHNKLPGGLLRQILRRDVTLVEIDEGGNLFDITFGLSRTHDKEGELSLNLKVNGETVFILSFTIVPGAAVKSPATDVLLITRIQGMKGCYPQIALATKALHDVAPAALLLSVLQGVAEALGIGATACIRATDQNSYCEECAAAFKTAYDEFFAERGVARNAANVYLTPLPIAEKPLGQVKTGHKLRTKKKRAFKRQIAERVCWFLGESCRGRYQPFPRMQLTPVPEAI